jgi:hypothetical protein
MEYTIIQHPLVIRFFQDQRKSKKFGACLFRNLHNELMKDFPRIWQGFVTVNLRSGSMKGYHGNELLNANTCHAQSFPLE